MFETLVYLLPELFLVLTFLVILTVDLSKSSYRDSIPAIFIAGVSASASSLVSLGFESVELHEYIQNSLVVNPLTQTFKLLTLTLAFLWVFSQWQALKEFKSAIGELFLLIIGSMLGMLFLLSSLDLLTFFVSFELMSVPLYVLAGFRPHNQKSAEAGLKYFLTGALCSGLLVFGLSLVFLTTQSILFADVAQGLNLLSASPTLAYLGFLMVLIPLMFKIGVAPFHLWVADVYSGAPSSLTGFFANLPKFVTICFLLRFFGYGFGYSIEGSMLAQGLMWTFLLLSFLSMFFGTFGALVQDRFKTLLAFSGIAQIGYLMLGFSALFTNRGSLLSDKLDLVGIVAFYAYTYVLTNMVLWTIPAQYEQAGKEATIKTMGGYGLRYRGTAYGASIALLSLAGAPPFVGFLSKLLLFQSALAIQPMVVLFALLASVISLFYYFRFVKVWFFEEPEDCPEGMYSLKFIFVALGIFLIGMTLKPVLLEWLQACANLSYSAL